MLPPLVPISLLICDGIHTDPYTGRRTLLGLFDEFTAAEYPATIPVCYVFAELTESIEPTTPRLRVTTNDPDMEPLWESQPCDVDGGTELALARMSVEWGVENLAFPEAGEYLVEVVDGNNRVVAERRLFLIQSPGPHAEESERDEE